MSLCLKNIVFLRHERNFNNHHNPSGEVASRERRQFLSQPKVVRHQCENAEDEALYGGVYR